MLHNSQLEHFNALDGQETFWIWLLVKKQPKKKKRKCFLEKNKSNKNQGYSMFSVLSLKHSSSLCLFKACLPKTQSPLTGQLSHAWPASLTTTEQLC